MFVDNSIIVANWPRRGAVKNNWGDKLNSYLIHRLSDMPVAHQDDIVGWSDRPVHCVIGSGLSSVSKNNIVWGMGFRESFSSVGNRNAQLYAVRGRLSRNLLVENNLHCPEIYGDPALLLPLIYWPKIEERFDYGIIQHYREIGKVPMPILPAGTSSIAIDITGDIHSVVSHILSCRTILSSSLHGIVCSHAYGKQAYWLKMSDLPLGDGFKFLDYFSSLDFEEPLQAQLSDNNVVHEIPESAASKNLIIDPDSLIDSCPFMSVNRKAFWKRRRKNMEDEGFEGVIF